MFYGINKDKDRERLAGAIGVLQDLYPAHYCSDMLCTFERNMSFLKDEKFRKAFFDNALEQNEQGRAWRLHTLCWAAQNALEVQGDLVECGTFNGFSMSVVLDYLGWKDLGVHEEKTVQLRS